MVSCHMMAIDAAAKEMGKGKGGGGGGGGGRGGEGR